MKTAQQILDAIDTLMGNVTRDQEGTVEAMKLIARRANAYAKYGTVTFDEFDEQVSVESLSDNQLVAAWRQGDELAEAELVRRYRLPLIQNIVALRVSEGEAAERLADAAFSDALEHFDPNDATIFCYLLHAVRKVAA